LKTSLVFALAAVLAAARFVSGALGWQATKTISTNKTIDTDAKILFIDEGSFKWIEQMDRQDQVYSISGVWSQQSVLLISDC
jgi:hypothetical protein